MALVRQVAIIGDDGNTYPTFATVWVVDNILFDSADHMISGIRDLISQMMTRLAVEYYKQNP